ncbi:MAG: hypothetical protein MZW92_72570 [Comamonadaceae bacterium]|nr:hypothetical protein [Comamonadaceae bacterium]
MTTCGPRFRSTPGWILPTWAKPSGGGWPFSSPTASEIRRPVFLTEGAEVAAPPRRLKERHVKLMLRQAGRTFEAIGWDHGDWADRFCPGSRVDCAYTFQTSNYLGEDRLYLGLEGLKPA